MTLRIGFAGSSAYSAACLRQLVERGVDVALVITQPDRPAGRRRVMTPPPCARSARALNLPLVQPEHARDALGAIHAAAVPTIIVCAYGRIIPTTLLDAALWLNLHPSLLPRWRGAAPIERAIMTGDAETGVAVMIVTDRLDAGPLVSVDRFPIGEQDDAGVVMDTSLRLGVPRLEQATSAAHAGQLASRPQLDAGVTYAAKITASDRALEPSGPAVMALRAIRALSPHIGAQISLGGTRCVIWQARPAARATGPGQVEQADGRIVIGFADAALEILRLQPAGRRPLIAAEFLRGWRQPLAPATRVAS